MRNAIRGAIVATLALGQWALAQAADFQPNITVLSDEIVYDVNADGTFTMDEIARLRINTDQGVKARSQLPLRYSASLQDLDVLEAYTTAKDGRRIDVAADKILLQQSPQSQNAPMFDDGKVKTIVFPAVEVGAVLTAHFRRTQKKPLFPGQFSAIEVASSGNEYQSERVTVRAPVGMKLSVDAIDMQGGQVASDRPGTQLWRWSIKDVAARAPELGSVGAIDHSPRVAVTSFPDFETAGRAYLARAQAKAEVTPSIQKLADEITRGVVDRRAQAEAIYRWVSANIRYVAVFLDFGGVVPHEAQAVVDARYGDCKDHVTVLEALLGDTYWLPKAAASPGIFNHAITYLPEFKLYVDSTAGVATFGVLPAAERGKRALVVDAGRGEPVIVTLPITNPSDDRIRIESKLNVDADGSVTGTTEIENAGVFDWVSRQLFSSLPPGVETQLASRVLTMTGQNGTGNYKHSVIRDLAAPFGYSTQFQLPGYVQLPGPGATAIPQGLSSFSNIATAFEQFGPLQRELPMPFLSRHITEVLTVTFPEQVKIANLPKPAKITSPFGFYESSYSIEGQRVRITRNLEIRMTGPLLQPADYPALRAMGQSVMRDLRSQIVY
jgi:transglutaminase-like putative cysteine protease